MHGARALLLALALVAMPGVAETSPLTHPAELCMEKRADTELGPAAIEAFLVRLGLKEGPGQTRDIIAPVMTPILEDCIKAHGEPQSDPDLVVRYLVASATRNEAGRQLSARGIDMAWLDRALAGKKGETGRDIQRIAGEIYVEMRRDPPTGLGIDVTQDDREGRITGVLIRAYTAGTLTAARLIPQLRQ
jgi:hypothetical protein